MTCAPVLTMMRSVPGGSSASGAQGKRCVGVDLPANGSNLSGQPKPRLSMSPTCTSSSASLAFFCSRCVAAHSGGRSSTGCFTLLSRRYASLEAMTILSYDAFFCSGVDFGSEMTLL
jgi:hypothetical protein